MSNRQYPYIQSETRLDQGTCSVCKKTKAIRRLEWRVDWFQGNCEFEDICQSCFDKRNNAQRRADEERAKKLEPILRKKREARERKVAAVESIITELGLDIKRYDNGQWSIGGVLDWWTTTGTAIERKNGRRHFLSFDKPGKIKSVLLNIINITK